MQLYDIYTPIKKHLAAVDRVLNARLLGTRYKSILELNDYLLRAKGKRLRPALVIICAKASSKSKKANFKTLFSIASAIELIHIASLVHDDIIDQATLRHHQPTIHTKFGEDVAVAFGDYLYSVAFELISSCNNPALLSCISQATKALCEGELVQVCERDNLSLLKERYILIAKKKTAALFAASCQSGAMVSCAGQEVQVALKAYGMNLGVAFQIIDDCRDLASNEDDTGKNTGLDFKMGELTLPVLNLLSLSADKNEILRLLKESGKKEAFLNLRQRFIDSPALAKTREDAFSYIGRAKSSLKRLKDTPYKASLLGLLDYVASKA